MEKSTEKLYALSLQAFRANRVEHSAWATAATSLEQAEVLGMAQALALWPKENGWSRHDASPALVTVEVQPVMAEALDQDEWPEMVM